MGGYHNMLFFCCCIFIEKKVYLSTVIQYPGQNNWWVTTCQRSYLGIRLSMFTINITFGNKNIKKLYNQVFNILIPFLTNQYSTKI